MNICVVGTGYVGLVTGAVFADLGNDVVCVDNDRAKIELLRTGQMTIYEPGLEEMVSRNMGDRRLSFTTDLAAGVCQSDVIFIAVGTPPKDSGETDLSQVEAVATEIGHAMDRYKVVVNKSTVPVGTGEFVREVIGRQQVTPIEFDVASNPFLAAKISFINAIANLCEAAGADVSHVIKGMGLDSRIGMQFLQPGLGYGGSCFPKDVDSLIYTASRLGYDFKLLRSVAEINRERGQHLVHMVEKAMGPLDERTVAVLGLAFKPNTDDMREAKSLEVVRLLRAAGAKVRAYDPVAMDNARRLL